MVDRAEAAQGGVVRRHVANGVVEIDVVFAAMGKRRGFEQRSEFGDAALQRLRQNQAFKAEHAGALQFLPASGKQRSPPGAVGRVEGKAVKVEQMVHLSGRIESRRRI